MKKTILFFCLILLPLGVKSQTKTITIDWGTDISEKIGETAEKSQASLQEKAISALNLQINDNRLIYIEQWEDNGFVDPTSLVISAIQYGSLSTSELKKVNKDLVPETPTYSISSNKSRDIIYTAVSISPVVKSNGSYRKVTSFKVSYNKRIGNSNQTRMQITNSVLATGAWYKFRVDRTGIHRIDRDFLNDLGMNTDGINPRNVKIYGHGGKPLPLRNRLNTEFDLPENAIQVLGEEDGSFDSGDAILFYGVSTQGFDDTEDSIYQLSSTMLNDTNLNPYSDESYYYVTADGGTGLRAQLMVEPTSYPTMIIDEFHDYQFHELDENSPGLVGRKWFGNRFDINSEQSFEFEFPNTIGNSDPMYVVIKAGASSESATSMAVTINGTGVDPLIFQGLSGQQVLNTDEYIAEIPASTGNTTMKIDLVYNNGGNPSSIGYLDYIGIEALRSLSGVNGQLAFKHNDVATSSGTAEYQIGNAAQFSQVWDVTNPKLISFKLNESGANSISFKAVLGEKRKYVAVNPNDYYVPAQIAQPRVVNQNIKGTIFNDESGNFQDLDYVIITAPFLIQPALRLANHHKEVTGLNVKVVTTDKIYEEFSSGKQDISAIRNFVRYLYENASSPDNRIKYIGLLGDTSIDYKNRLVNNNNIIPTYHTLSSNNTHYSYMSDDFFGIMGSTIEDDEGTMIPSDRLDVAVGRILADNVSLANAMVDKVINYSSKESYGNWRNNFVLISDDVDKNNEEILEVNLDALGDEIAQQKPFVNVKKIHSDAYQQQTSAGGKRYPEVNEAIKNNIELGAVIINYFGHGGEDGLAHEFIYTKDMANNLQNKNRYPCLVTLTCELTKFDNPLRVTAGELTYTNREGGAIALLTTTRSISIGTGVAFNEALASELFGFGTNEPNNPAEALRMAKSQINSSERRVVFFIGDPAMPLSFPKKEIRLTTLNGAPISSSSDVLKALDRVSVGGEVVDENGTILSNYSGILEAKVYDKNVERQTLANDGSSNNFVMDFVTLGEVLFNGQATVVNGTFEFDFVMPRDTQIPVGNGRISLYSQKNNALDDQTGVNLDIQIGGLNENAASDNIGPLISLFMNDDSFVSGGITNDSPILIAKLEDENGMNTASGIGHDMIAILDGDESNPFVLNEYYQADVDDYTKGSLKYKLRDLEDGLHTLTVKAWDVYNNSSTEEIQFVVAGGDALEITRVLNYPNPFVNYTEFWFNHNRPYETLDVQVQVFTVTGKVVWSKSETLPAEGTFLSRKISWDGKDDFGDRIGKGVYVYKLTVRSSVTNKRVEKFEKLVIL